MYSDEQLAIFSQIVKRGSFSKAAAERGRSQASVSQAINKLEQTLGYSVFDRQGKKLSLNPRGKQLYQYNLQRNAATDRLKRIAENLNQQIESELKLYLDVELNPSRMADVLSQFHQHFPTTQITMQSHWQDASFVILAEDKISHQGASEKHSWQPCFEEKLIPACGTATYQNMQYIEVPWGPNSPEKQHLTASRPAIALQMVLASMGWSWIHQYLLANYQQDTDYKQMSNIEPIVRYYFLGVSGDKGPALTWLTDQVLNGHNGVY